MATFDKVCTGLQWNGLRHWMGFAYLKLFGQLSSGRRWCSRHYIPIGRLMAISTVVVLILLLLVLRGTSNKDMLRSLYVFLKDTSLLFVDLYHIVLLLRCWGKAQDRQSELTVTGRPTCVSALNPNCSLGFSPLGVCRLWNLICSGWGNVRGTLNGRRRQIEGKCKYIQIKHE